MKVIRTSLFILLVFNLVSCRPASDEVDLGLSDAAMLKEAERLLKAERYIEADSILVAHADAFSESGDWLALMGRLKLALFEEESAVEFLQKAVDIDEEDLSVRLLLIQTYQRLGDLEMARNLIEAAPQKEHPRIHYEKGQISLKEGQLEDAIILFSKAIESDTTYIEALYAKGNVLSRLGRAEEAAEVLLKYEWASATNDDLKLDQQILELNPDSPEAHYNLARAYEGTGEWQKAMHYYHEAVLLDPSFQEAYNNMGILYFQAGQDERAVEAFDKAISLSDTTASYYFNLGAVYAKRGVLDEAVRLWGEGPRN